MSEHPKLGEWYDHPRAGRCYGVGRGFVVYDDNAMGMTALLAKGHRLRHLAECPKDESGWAWDSPVESEVWETIDLALPEEPDGPIATERLGIE